MPSLKLHFFLFFLFISFPLLAQKEGQALIDSLWAEVPKAKEDTNKVNLLIEISWQDQSFNHTDDGIKAGTEALALAEKLKWDKGIGKANAAIGNNYSLMPDSTNSVQYYLRAIQAYKKCNCNQEHAKALMNLGNLYRIINQYALALEYDQKAIDLSTETGLMNALAGGHINMATVYKEMGDPEKALEHSFTALKINETLGDRAKLILNLNTIATIYDIQSNYQKSLEYHLQSLEHAQKSGSKSSLADVYSNLGVVYGNSHQDSLSLAYYRKAIAIYEELNNRFGMATTYTNIGIKLGELRQYKEALNYELAALKFNKEGGLKTDLLQSYFGMASVYGGIVYNQDEDKVDASFGKNRAELLQKSMLYMDTVVTLAKETGEFRSQLDAYTALVELRKMSGDYEGALKDLEHSIILKDSIISEERDRKMTQTTMQYEFDKKEAIAQSVLQRQKLLRNIFVGGFAGLLLFASIVVQQRNKIKKEKIRAEHSEKFRQQFLANMSHEIRTPMNAIMGITNLMLDTSLDQKQQKYLTSVKNASENLLYIINDILDLSKLEAGKIELEQIHYSIRDLMEEVREILQHKANEKGLEWMVHVEPNVPEVLVGDPMRLMQVLLNLTGNALKFTEKGSVVILVKKNADNTLHVSIQDTGIGIPADKLNSIFESFSQAHTSDSRKYGGTGLGLTISKQFVELMSGTLQVESVEGSGTTFSFDLPMVIGSKESANAATANNAIDAASMNGLRILLVDDLEDNRIVCRDTLLSKAQVQITEAKNGQEALDWLQKEEFDVVLMDVQMPVMDGYEATRKVRSQQSAVLNSKIPIIALTASVIRSDLDKCKQAGMNDYVPKPFKPYQLIEAIVRNSGRPFLYTAANEGKKDKNEFEAINQATAIVDLTFLTKLCDGDTLKMQKYINLFLQNMPDSLEKLKAAWEEKNYLAIASQVHADKTKWMMMGMTETQQLATKIEIDCRSDNPDVDSIGVDVAQLIQVSHLAVVQLREQNNIPAI